jgi:hypothetical protein
VVDVQVRADHDVDVVRREPSGCHAREERRVETAEQRDAGPLLGIAGAGVVQHREPVDLQDPTLQECIEAVGVVAVVLRSEPGRQRTERRLVIPHEKRRGRQEIPLPLLDVMHADRADAQRGPRPCSHAAA